MANNVTDTVNMPVILAHKRNFETIQRAFQRGDVGMIECEVKSTGEKVAVIAAMTYDSDTQEFITVPFASFFNGNPYELLNPPNPEGGFYRD